MSPNTGLTPPRKSAQVGTVLAALQLYIPNPAHLFFRGVATEYSRCPAKLPRPEGAVACHRYQNDTERF